MNGGEGKEEGVGEKTRMVNCPLMELLNQTGRIKVKNAKQPGLSPNTHYTSFPCSLIND